MKRVVGDIRTGEPVAIEGFAALYGDRCGESVQRREAHADVIAPGCFDGCDVTGARFNGAHLDDYALDGRLEIALTASGLAFRLSEIDVTPAARAVVEAIASGRSNGCSFAGVVRLAEIEQQGECISALSRVERLEDIAAIDAPTFPSAGCWLSNQAQLPARLQALRRRWRAEAAAARWITAT